MDKDRSSLRLILSILTIFAFVLLASMAAYFLQSSTVGKRQAQDEQVELMSLLQRAENAIASSMFPPHDYLITGENNERAIFRKKSREVESHFRQLRRLPHLEKHDIMAIDKAYAHYQKLFQTEKRILALKDPRTNPQSPRMMEKMHAYQNGILKEFERFANLEQAELDARQQRTVQAESRWFVVIGLVAALVASVSTLTIISASRTPS